MAKTRTLEGGQQAIFPDDMSDDEIDQIVGPAATATAAPSGDQDAGAADQDFSGGAGAGNLPGYLPPGAPPNTVVMPPPTGLERLSQVGGPAALKGVSEGVGFPGDVVNYFAPAARQALDLPTSQDIQQWSPLKGILENPTAAPRTEFERYLAGGAENIGAAAPYALLGGPIAAGARAAVPFLAGTPGVVSTAPSLTGEIAKSLLQTGLEAGGAGIGGVAGQEALPNNPQLGAAIGTFAGMGAGGAARATAGRLVNAAIGNEGDVVSSMGRLGMTPRLAGDVTQDPLWQGLQATALRAPGGGRAIEAATRQTGEWGNGVEIVANGIDPTGTVAQNATDMGNRLQKRFFDWIPQSDAEETRLWAPLNQLTGTPTLVTNTVNRLHALSGGLPGAPNVSAVMGDPVAKDLAAALGRDVQSPFPGYDTLPWQTVQQWRSQVGAKIKQSVLAADGKEEDWRSLYNSLSQDLEATANANNLGTEFARANQFTRNQQQFYANVGKYIANKSTAEGNTIPGAAATRDAFAGSNLGGPQAGARLAAIRDNLGPDALDELAAYNLNQMKFAVPSQQSEAGGGGASPGSYMTRWNQLSPEARTVLYGDPTAQQASRVADVNTVAGAIKSTAQRYGNISQTEGARQHYAGLASAMALPSAIAEGYHLGGVPGAVTGGTLAAGPMLIGPTAANLTARPTLARLLAIPSGAVQSVLQRWAPRVGAAVPLMQQETGR